MSTLLLKALPSLKSLNSEQNIMAHTFKDDVRPDDFDDYVCLQQRQLRSRLAAHPDPRDPEYPLADCDPEDVLETEDINDEPVPYTNNKES